MSSSSSSLTSYSRVGRVESKIRVAGGSSVVDRRSHTHAFYSDAQTAFYRYTFDSPPTNHFRSSGTVYRPIIRKGQINALKHASLSVTLTLASDIQLAPMPLWWSRIRILSGSEVLWSIEDEPLMFSTMSQLKPSDRRGVFRQMAMCADPMCGYVEGDTYPAGTYTFVMPFISSFWNTVPLWFKSGPDWVLELTPAASIALSGTNADISVNAMSLLMETDTLMDGEARAHEILYKTVAHTSRFLEPQRLIEETKTLTAGSPYRFSLKDLRGKVSHLILGVRSTSSALNFNFVPLGRGATLDIVNSGNTSVIGMGTALDCDFLRNEVWHHHFGNDLSQVKNLYMIPFANNIAEAYRGKMDGFLEFDPSDSYSLAIAPAATLTAEVHRLTSSLDVGGGHFRLRYKNSMTDPLLFTSSAAELKAAFDALKDARREGVTATFSGAFHGAALGIVDVTYSANFQYDGKQSLIQVVDVTMTDADGNPLVVTTTRHVAGNQGFVTGNYNIVVAAYKFKEHTSYAGTERVIEL